MKTIAFIPARGGSESIHLKNLAMLGERTLLEWVLEEAMSCDFYDKIVVSTDNDLIAATANKYWGWDNRIVVHERPEHLTDGLSYPIEQVIHHYLMHTPSYNKIDAVGLLQPTSPFVAKEQMQECYAILKNDATLNSVQTISKVLHNDHAYNQRIRTLSRDITWRFPMERLQKTKKQDKRPHFKFGNFVITRTEALFGGETFFALPSRGVEIGRFNAIDVDTMEDLKWANHILKAGPM